MFFADVFINRCTGPGAGVNQRAGCRLNLNLVACVVLSALNPRSPLADSGHYSTNAGSLTPK